MGGLEEAAALAADLRPRVAVLNAWVAACKKARVKPLGPGQGPGAAEGRAEEGKGREEGEDGGQEEGQEGGQEGQGLAVPPPEVTVYDNKPDIDALDDGEECL